MLHLKRMYTYTVHIYNIDTSETDYVRKCLLREWNSFMFSETWNLKYRLKDNHLEMYVYITQVS